MIDVVVDANRDGVVDPAADPDYGDDVVEIPWTATEGAAFIANLDDDDQNGVRDADDDFVNGEADALDLARIVTAPWPNVAEGAIGVLTIDQESAESVRIFKQGADGSWTLVLGSFGPCTSPSDCSYTLEHVLTPDETRNGATFGIEGRRFRGMPLPSLDPQDGAKTMAWNGLVELAYHVEDAGRTGRFATEDEPDGIDRARMRIAPWILLGSLGTHDKLYSANWSAPLVTDLGTASEMAAQQYTAITMGLDAPNGWTDIWTEDFFQTGWTGFPGPNGTLQGMRIYNPRPWGRPPQNQPTPEQVKENLPISWILGYSNPQTQVTRAGIIGPDIGGGAFYAKQNEGTGHTQDSHGNHDVVPPYDGYPMGRIFTGNKVLASTMQFYEAQQVQGPPIVVDTTWLAVEHVDEFFHFSPATTPRGWKLIVANPEHMTQVLQELQSNGHGAAVLHQGLPQSAQYGFEKTVDQALANAELNAWSQKAWTKIQGHMDVMIQEGAITEQEIIYLPTWFEDLATNELVAWTVGTVNMRTMGNVAAIPKPFGPNINGSDPFEDLIQQRLGGPESQLGSDGQGLNIHFTNGWSYHVGLGEVHCASNQSAPITPDLGLWWESGK